MHGAAAGWFVCRADLPADPVLVTGLGGLVCVSTRRPCHCRVSANLTLFCPVPTSALVFLQVTMPKAMRPEGGVTCRGGCCFVPGFSRRTAPHVARPTPDFLRLFVVLPFSFMPRVPAIPCPSSSLLWVLFGPGGALYLGGLRNSHRARCQVSGPARASTSWLSSLIAVSDELVDTSDR